MSSSSLARVGVGAGGGGGGISEFVPFVDYLLPHVISASIYMWATVCLARVKYGSSGFIWMHVPWLMFGIASQLLGIISFFILPTTTTNYQSESSTDSDSKRKTSQQQQQQQQLCRVFRESEKTLMWLQIDVGYSLIATSHWMLVSESPGRMIATVFVVSSIPLLAWALVYPEEAVALVQMTSLVPIMATLHANVLALNVSGLVSTLLMLIYLGLLSLPLYDIPFLKKLPLELVILIYPALLSHLLVLSFADLLQAQNVQTHWGREEED